MPEPIDRRQFLSAAAAMALLGGATITIGCGGSEPPTGPNTPPPPPGPPPTPSAKNGVVDVNHGHVARIQGAQLEAGGGVALDITGNASHPHTVFLTAEQVVAIRAGNRVQVQSSTDLGAFGEHSHTVVFS